MHTISLVVLIFLLKDIQMHYSDHWSIFRPLPTQLPINLSPPEGLLFTVTYNRTGMCCATCAHHPNCNFTVTYQDICYGYSSFQKDDASNTNVDVYVKHPPNVCNTNSFVYVNGLCLLVTTFKLTWYDAKDYCERLNSSLIVLDSPVKHDQLGTALTNYFAVKSYFVGAYETTDGDWTWITPGSTNYFNWKLDEPDSFDYQNRGMPANCVATRQSNHLLQDEYCYQNKCFICEI